MRRVLGVALLAALATWAGAQTFTGKVVHVADGDTIVVLNPRNQQVRVRFFGIDAPEKNQAYADRAKQFLTDMVLRQTVRVETRDLDQYGRTLGFVKLGDKNVNVELVRNGYAWWYRRHAENETVLKDAEQEARAAGRGLWRDANPIAPWEFRRGQGR